MLSPPYISWIGMKFPWNEMVNVAVIVLLSELLLIATVEEFFFVNDDCLTGTYWYVVVWSRLMISKCGMLNSSTLDITSCWNINFTFFNAPSRFSNFDVIAMRRRSSILWKKLWAQCDAQYINALPVLTTTSLVITVPRLLPAWIYR